ncbi:uncharacterized protein BDZ99DRAFT_301470 [Mytilinidion resinicola]|uniref:Uncharacterized protein n=1 Tax=Mytilinidion resinicola TaxID=574789 RepID=A0A6A6YN75_9PEZI|nr:uncharacterized protein BDZ99DRAFT_301470 [Mytilinidion resinicola]KAF2810009.1 hypothetical protein BDZ99DRAFT_301470 [Mytilinidion resinicola]
MFVQSSQQKYRAAVNRALRWRSVERGVYQNAFRFGRCAKKFVRRSRCLARLPSMIPEGVGARCESDTLVWGRGGARADVRRVGDGLRGGHEGTLGLLTGSLACPWAVWPSKGSQRYVPAVSRWCCGVAKLEVTVRLRYQPPILAVHLVLRILGSARYRKVDSPDKNYSGITSRS